MRHHKLGARARYRQQELQRVNDSVSLAKKFRKLKSLTVELEFRNPERLRVGSHLKYKVNLENTKSVFRFDCPNTECICGDFDLSEVLAKAVTGRRKTVSGEVTCPGWRSRACVGEEHCPNVLRYRFNLGY